MAQITRPFKSEEDAEYTTQIATEVEVVSEDEIYLLVEVYPEQKEFRRYTSSKKFVIEREYRPPRIRRGRRICGRLRYKEGRPARCKRPAGAGTDHQGLGYCNIHERFGGSPASRNLRILGKYEKAGLALKLRELDEFLPELFSDPEYDTIRDEIHTLHGLLHIVLNRGEAPSDVAQALAIIEQLKGLKLAKSRIDSEKLLLTVNSIHLFVNSILDIILKTLGPTNYGKVLREFQERLVFPINRNMQEALEIKQSIVRTGEIDVSKKGTGNEPEAENRAGPGSAGFDSRTFAGGNKGLNDK